MAFATMETPSGFKRQHSFTAVLLRFVILSAFFARRTYVLASGGTATFLKTSPSQVDRILDPKRDITLSSLQKAAALVGQRVVIELV